MKEITGIMLLIGGVMLISYAMATPGQQVILSTLGGIALIIFATNVTFK